MGGPEQSGPHTQPVDSGGMTGSTLDRRRFAREPEKMPHDQARARCPSRSSRRASRPRARPCRGLTRSYSRARLVPVRRTRRRSTSSSSSPGAARAAARRAHADRVRLAQRVKNASASPTVRQRLGVAQVRVHVHEADLAAEERARSRRAGRASSARRDTAAAGRTGARRRAREMLLDQAQVVARLLGREQVVEDRVDHRQQAVAHAGRSSLGCSR